MSYQPKTYRTDNGDTMVIANGGVLDLKTGAIIKTDGTQGAALTAQLTSITHTAPGTPDYAVQDLVASGGFGFVTKDEGNTVLSVIKNLQVRVAELEARLEASGFVAAN